MNIGMHLSVQTPQAIVRCIWFARWRLQLSFFVCPFFFFNVASQLFMTCLLPPWMLIFPYAYFATYYY